MTVLVDAQLPRRLARWLTASGPNAVHTLDLPEGNRTTDAEIARRADAEGRVLMTKDADFVRAHVLGGSPRRLWLVSTGNLRNDALERIVERHIGVVADLFATAAFVEMTADALVVHA